MRLPDADPDESPELAAAFAEFRRTRGIVSNVMKSFAHAPRGLAAIVALGGYCRYQTELSERQREMVILITGRGVDYAWDHHAPLGLKAGLSEAELGAIRAGQVPQGLPDHDQALAEYVFAYAALAGVPAPVFDRLRAHFSPRQITDINIISGYYLMIAASIIGMEVTLDPASVRDAETRFHAARHG